MTIAYAYDPYGVQTITKDAGGNATDQIPYTFKCGLQDRTTGWVHYGARWYDPTTGRWTQQDTLDSPLDPGNANRYAYAGNDPINNADPLGRDILHDVVYGCLSGALGSSLLALLIAPETGLVGGTGVAVTGCAIGASVAYEVDTNNPAGANYIQDADYFNTLCEEFC